MNVLFSVCLALSFGITAGFAVGGIKALFLRKSYSAERVESVKKIVNRLANVLKYITFMLLALGLVWCVYFLILGVVVPDNAGYANNMAELIVAVLTVISIIFAFVEFLKRKDDKK